jgi:hypothetical protein
MSTLEIVLLTVLAGFAAGALYKVAVPSEATHKPAGQADANAVEAARAHRAGGQPRELRGGAVAPPQADSPRDAAPAAEPPATGEVRANGTGDEDEGLDPIGMKRKGGLTWKKAADAAPGPAGPAVAGPGPAAGPARSAAIEKMKEAAARGEPIPPLSHGEVAKLQEPDIREALQLLEAMPWGPEASRMFQDVIGRWGQVNPAAAMEYAMSLESLRTRNSAVSSVLDTWSRTDPQAAYAWFNQQMRENPGSVYGATRNLFNNMAHQDSNWALSQAWSLQDPGIKRTALQSIYDRMVRDGQGDELVSLHDRMAAGADRNMLSEAIIAMWTPYQPERAAQWAIAIEDAQTRQKSLDRVVASWTSDRPSEAADFVMNLPEGDQRNRSLARVVETWARGDLERAADWLARYPPSPQMDPAMQSLAQVMTARDPAAAVSWANNIVDAKTRERALSRAAFQWMQVAPDQARAAIPGLGLSPQMQQRILGTPAGR